MLRISQKQALERWDNLPENLREAIFSEQNTDILWRFCESQHLSGEKIYKIATLAGDVIMGFIHPEDLTKEITDSLQIDSQIASAISAEMDKKIFASIKEDLKKVYAPAPAASWGENVIDLKVPKPEEKPAAINVDEADQLSPLSFGVNTAKVEMIKNLAGGNQAQSQPQGGAISEEAPVIIHEETKLKPAAGTIRKSLGGLFGFGSGSAGAGGSGPSSGSAGAVTAQVKLGAENLSVPVPAPAVQKTEEQKTRIVHYTELRTPLSPLGGAGQVSSLEQPVSLNSITQPVQASPTPKPSNLVAPSDFPKPPAPPMPSQTKQTEPQFSVPMSQISQSKIEEIKPSIEKNIPPPPLKITPKPAPDKPKDETVVDLRTFQIDQKPTNNNQ